MPYTVKKEFNAVKHKRNPNKKSVIIILCVWQVFSYAYDAYFRARDVFLRASALSYDELLFSCELSFCAWNDHWLNFVYIAIIIFA